MTPHSIFSLCTAALAATLAPLAVHAQNPLPGIPPVANATTEARPADQLPALPEVKERRTTVQQTLKSLQKEPTVYKDQIGLLADLDATLARQEEALTVQAYLENEITSLGKISQLPIEVQINEKFTKPYDLAELDSLYQERENQEEESRLALDAALQADELLTRDQKAYEKSEESRRLAKDLPSDLSVSASVADLQSQVGLAKLIHSKINTANTKLKKETLEIRKNILEPHILYVRNHLQLNDSTWRDLKRHYDSQELSIKESLSDAQNKVATSQRELDKIGTLSPLASPTEKARQEAWQIALLAAQRRTSLNETWKEQIRLTREIMQHRYELYGNKVRSSDKRLWTRTIEETLARLEPQYDHLGTSMQSAEKQLEALRSKARESTDNDVQAWTETAVRHQTYLISSFQEEIWSTKAIIQLSQRLLAELNDGKKSFSLQELGADGWNLVKGLWYKELFQLEDRAFRISTLFWVIFWVSIGFFVAWAVSTLLGKKILLHYGFASGAASAYQKLVYYTIVVFFCVGIFEYFNFNLTSLTIISGALALGVGFGSQDIIKNFISGLILLFERPVNEGDIIQIEGDAVHVEHIGARSTRVKAFDNTQRIVPNSYLLENVIINWTLSDDIIRSTIQVGVAYGSAPRLVTDTLLQAVQSMESVLKDPEPVVYFTDFSDSALLFNVLFSSASSTRLDTTSEARHKIYEALQQAGISLPFPQRDVHLDTLKPLEFRLLRGAPPSPKP